LRRAGPPVRAARMPKMGNVRPEHGIETVRFIND
jgi:hypothetical protein